MKMQEFEPHVWYDWSKFPTKPTFYKGIEEFEGWSFDILVKYYDSKHDMFRHHRVVNCLTTKWEETNTMEVEIKGEEYSARIVGFMVHPDWTHMAENLI